MKPTILILTNARVYTGDPAQLGDPTATAIVIQAGRILDVGSTEKMLAEYSEYAMLEDLHGQFILPGLTDAHIHLMQYSLGLQKIDCETRSRVECLKRVGERAKTARPGEWILGHGWNQNEWPEGFGNLHQLDAIAPNNPVYLTSKSLHSGWANSAALRLAGIQDQSPNPPDGRLGRSSDARLDGILFESAMELIERVIPEPTDADIIQAIEKAQPILWRLGLTGIHDFDRGRCFAALQVLHQRGSLKLRVTKSIPLEDLEYAIAIGLRTGFGDDFLRIGSVKAFADGALGPHTAAMFSPYEDDPDNRGILMLDGETLYEHARQASAHGLSMAVHAIGDRANHEVLDAFEHLRAFEQQNSPPGSHLLRHRIEHVQVLHPDDVARLAKLKIIASMQPIHATSDMLMADRYWGKRSALSYAWRTQLQEGATLAFGSDAPVESPNPFWGLHAALTRQRQDGTPGEQGWYPEQRLRLAEALAGFTTGAAYAANTEYRSGRLAPGYYADLIVLERNPFEMPPVELANTTPVATMVNGEWVFKQ
jgi:predicted amidohydrolase YtcJ